MANLIFGRRLFGRWIFAGKSGSGTGGGLPVIPTTARPGEFSVKVYNDDGTKLAEWGSSIKNNPVLKLDFELLETGCGAFSMTLGELPATAALDYGMRLDIHLFGDALPWYSGLVLERPVAGTTVTPYLFKGYGFFQQLEWLLVNTTFESEDIAAVAKSILQTTIEPDTKIVYAASKITNVGYSVTKLRFDNIDCKEAMKQLAEFATDYVYGVDELREFFFRPLNTDINEQARLYVGVHINDYTPTEDLTSLCNYALIKGATLDANGSNIIGTPVEDATSQTTYGIRKKVLSVPSAVTDADATRWGTMEVGRLKDPKRRATIKGLKLEYPNSDGSYNVRRIKPDGKAAVTPLDGSAAHEYLISKVKYTISSSGIVADITLGDPKPQLQDWFVQASRDKKTAEALDAINNRQLKGAAL